LRARSEGPFVSLEDFYSRVNTRIVNRKALESLVKSGAFDRFGDRAVLLFNLDTVLAFAQRIQKDRASGQTDLFGNVIAEDSPAGGGDLSIRTTLKLDEAAPKINQHEQLKWERDLLGLYLSRHPLELYETFLQEQCVPLNSIKPMHDGKAVIIGGAVGDVREITTKNGQKMAFIKIEDAAGEIEALLFPGSYQKTLGLWERDKVVLVRGKLSAKDRNGELGEEVKVLVDDAREITHEQASSYQSTGRKPKALATTTTGRGAVARAMVSNRTTTKVAGGTAPTAATEAAPRLYIRLPDAQDQQILMSLKETIDAHMGQTDVVLVLGDEAARQIIKLPSGVSHNQDVLGKLQTLVGADNVRIQ
jgi:DNA polymerase III alpha subunit